MKLPSSLLLVLLAGSACAAEPVTLPLEVGTLQTVGVGSRTYDGVKIIERDAVGIKISHEGGISRVPYAKLPRELAARFTVDRDAAKEQLNKEAEQGAAYEQAVAEGLKAAKEAEPASAEEKPVELDEMRPQDDDESDEAFIARLLGQPRPNMAGKTRAERAVVMRVYIVRLEGDLRKAELRYKNKIERRNSGKSTTGGGRIADQRFYSNSETTERARRLAEERAERIAFLRRQKGMDPEPGDPYARQKDAMDEIRNKLEAAKKELTELEK